MRSKNKIIEKVTIESVAAEGKCVARIDEKVVFVEGVAPGDIVDIKVLRKKKSFLEAAPTVFHTFSSERTTPFCSHFGTCGGCKWQHMDYAAQLIYKRQQVIDNLERIAKVNLPKVPPTLASSATRYYRNKLEFTFSNKRWLTYEEIEKEGTLERNALGFHIPRRFDKILDIDHCYLQADPSNAIRLAVKEFALQEGLTFFDLREQVGLLRNLIIRTTDSGETMVIVQVAAPDMDKITLLMEHLKERFPTINSLNYIINTKKNETFQDQEVINYDGLPYITECMPVNDDRQRELKFRIGPKSFYQTNSQQAYQLYKIARDFADLKGDETVYDLYTGTGTIANFIAGSAARVIGLEYVPEAIEDAKTNSSINDIDNTDFYAGDIKDLLNDAFLDKHGRPDAIITDPPRAGMHADVVAMLNTSGAEKIIYISCNPATQARDLALLDEQYAVVAIQPVDMFPHTHHVENVVLLHKRP